MSKFTCFGNRDIQNIVNIVNSEPLNWENYLSKFSKCFPSVNCHYRSFDKSSSAFIILYLNFIIK